MLEAGWGRIVNISTSVDTMLRFWPYGSAKAALDAQTAVLAVQLEGTGVTANILGPGTFVKPAPIVLDDGTVIRPDHGPEIRSEEHTSELQSLMRISYAVFCLTTKNQTILCTSYDYNCATKTIA